MQDILSHHQIDPSLLPLFLDHADGVAALALLCNAAAKDNLAFYLSVIGLYWFIVNFRELTSSY